MANNAVQSDSQIHHHCPACGHAAQASPAADAGTATTTPTNSTRCLSLATRLCDQVAELTGAVNGYLALESFVSPTYADETQASVPPPRIQLAGMLRALNALVLQRIDALDLGVTVLHAQLSEGGEAQAR